MTQGAAGLGSKQLGSCPPHQAAHRASAPQVASVIISHLMHTRPKLYEVLPSAASRCFALLDRQFVPPLILICSNSRRCSWVSLDFNLSGSPCLLGRRATNGARKLHPPHVACSCRKAAQKHLPFVKHRRHFGLGAGNPCARRAFPNGRRCNER